jgi:hypothetical protein
MASNGNKEAFDKEIEQVVSYTAGRLAEDAAEGINPPFGLLEIGSYNDFTVPPQPVRAFDQRDPFGHLGKTVADSLAVISTELDGQVAPDTVSFAAANFYPGSIMMGYLLAMVPKVYGRDLPDSEPTPAELADTARASYLDIVKKFATHDRSITHALIVQNLAIPLGPAIISLPTYRLNFPLGSNMFSDRHFDLTDTPRGHKLSNPTFDVDREADEHICPSSRVAAASGQIALKLVWNHMVDIAERAHYADLSALQWAKR